MTDIATLQLRVDSLEARIAQGDLDRLGQSADRTERSTRVMERGFASVTSVLKTLAPAIGAISFGAIAKQMIDVARETENFKAQLKTMVGSTEAAGQAFDRLNEFAKTTPYTLQQSIDGFVKLKALGLDPSERAMKSYGNTAAAMGTSMTQMIEAVADAATGENERLKAFGITASKAGDMVTYTFRGVETTMKATSENIQRYLMSIGETNFGTAMIDKMDTIDGQLSNLEQSFNDLWRAIGDQLGVTDAVKSALAEVASVLGNLIKIVENSDESLGKFNIEIQLFADQWGQVLGLLDGNEVTALGKEFEYAAGGIKKATGDVKMFLEILGAKAFDFFIDAMKNLPANFATVIQVMIGEYLKFKSTVDNNAEILVLEIEKAFVEMGGAINGTWLVVKKAFAEMIDWVLRKLSDGLSLMSNAVKDLPFMGETAAMLDKGAKGLNEYATAAKTVDNQIKDLILTTAERTTGIDEEIQKTEALKDAQIKSYNETIDGYLKQNKELKESLEIKKALMEDERQWQSDLKNTFDIMDDFNAEFDNLATASGNAANKTKEVKEILHSTGDQFPHWLMETADQINEVTKNTGKLGKETKKELTEMEKRWADFADQVENDFIDGFVDQLFDARGDWSDFLEDMLKDWLKTMAKMEMKSWFTGSGSMLFGGGYGGSAGGGFLGDLATQGMTSAASKYLGVDAYVDQALNWGKDLVGYGSTNYLGTGVGSTTNWLSSGSTLTPQLTNSVSLGNTGWLSQGATNQGLGLSFQSQAGNAALGSANTAAPTLSSTAQSAGAGWGTAAAGAAAIAAIAYLGWKSSTENDPTNYNIGFGTPVDFNKTQFNPSMIAGVGMPTNEGILGVGSGEKYKFIIDPKTGALTGDDEAIKQYFADNAIYEAVTGNVHNGIDPYFIDTFGENYDKINTDKGFSFNTPFGMGGFEIEDTGKKGQISDEEAIALKNAAKPYFDAIAEIDTNLIKTFNVSTDTIASISDTLSVFSDDRRSFEGAQGVIKERFQIILDGVAPDIGEAFSTLEGTTESVVGVLSSYVSGSEELRNLYAELYGSGERSAESMLNQVSTLQTVNSMFDMLGVSAYDLSIAGIEASTGLVDAAGGLENLSALTGNFFNAFYTDAEKAAYQTNAYADAITQLNDTYGVSLSTSTDSYKSTVQAILGNVDANDDLKVALLALTPTVQSVKQAEDALTAARDKAAKEAERLAEAERKATAKRLESLEELLIKLSGKTEFDLAKETIAELSDIYGDNTDELRDYILANQDSISKSEDATNNVIKLSSAFDTVGEHAQDAFEKFQQMAIDFTNRMIETANSLANLSFSAGNISGGKAALEFANLGDYNRLNLLLDQYGLNQLSGGAGVGLKNQLENLMKLGTQNIDLSWHEDFQEAEKLVASLYAANNSYLTALENSKTKTDTFTESVADLGEEVDEITPQIESLISAFEQAIEGIKSLRQSIQNDMYGFGVDKNFGSIESDLRAMLNGSADDIGIYDSIRQNTVEMYQFEIQQAQNLHQIKVDAANEEYSLKLEQWNEEKTRIDSLNSAYKAIADYAKAMISPFDLTTSQAKSNYGQLLLKAQAGDLESLQGLTGAADDYLTSLRGSASTSLDYRRGYYGVKNTLGMLGSTELTYTPFERENIKLAELDAELQAEISKINQRAVDALGDLDDEIVNLQNTLTTEFEQQTNDLLEQMTGDTTALINAITNALGIKTTPVGTTGVSGTNPYTGEVVTTPAGTGGPSFIAPGYTTLENQQSIVNEMYSAFGVNPDTAGFNYWVNESGLIGDALRNAMIDSAQSIDPDKYGDIAKFDIGGIVPRDGMAYIHKNERVLTAEDNKNLHQEINSLRSENKALLAQNNKLLIKVNRIFDKWDNDGLPAERAA